jgi:hypothetical protein
VEYSVEVMINRTRAAVLELLLDRGNDVVWRPDLVLCEQIVGEPGVPGAETRLLYHRSGDRVREWMERVVSNELPDSIEFVVTSPHVVEHQLHTFSEDTGGRTSWSVRSRIAYHRAGLAERLHSSKSEEQCNRAMESFKSFAEGPQGRTLTGNQLPLRIGPRVPADGRA